MGQLHTSCLAVIPLKAFHNETGCHSASFHPTSSTAASKYNLYFAISFAASLIECDQKRPSDHAGHFWHFYIAKVTPKNLSKSKSVTNIS
jgi:hypothetical protein